MTNQVQLLPQSLRESKAQASYYQTKMKHRNWTKPEEFWKDWQPYFWVTALSLPTLPWARPFLEMMGLPTAMIEQPEVWASIGTQLLAEYNTGMKPADVVKQSDSRGI